ncbi:hypothetical protein HC776_01190 [bacterium]|nr:hypothetical protein [bacterium]
MTEIVWTEISGQRFQAVLAAHGEWEDTAGGTIGEHQVKIAADGNYWIFGARQHGLKLRR